MNIEFKIPMSEKLVTVDYNKISYIQFFSRKTNFNSSFQLILTLKPDNVIIINTLGTKTNELYENYQKILRNQK